MTDNDIAAQVEHDVDQAERNRRRLRIAGGITAVLIMGATFFAGAAYAYSGQWAWLIVASGWTTLAAFVVGFLMGRSA